MDKNKHYISIDEQNIIIKGFSDVFEQPTDTDICIDENGQRHFELFGEINPALINEQGIALYKWDGEQVAQRTTEEIQTELDELYLLHSLVPTQDEIDKAIRTIETIELLKDLEVIQ